jgi:F-type H+-transporting ATPase subunit b
MPQIAQIAETFGSQFFWLFLTFGLIYLIVGRGMVPKISGTVQARDGRIADDLTAAERARADADAREEAYRVQTETNRAEALKLTQAAKESAAQATELRVKTADAETGEQVGAAEARIRLAAATAMADIETVAAQAAQEMVAKLSGAQVSREQAVRAARMALTHG